jgi:predicted transport protein
MAYFLIDNNTKLQLIKEKPFKLEKDIQKITELNLKEIFGLEFVCSEFTVKNFRIDTLAYDRESNSFVIIEYKKDKNFSVIDQGFAYLSCMLNNKSDFILEYNEHNKNSLKREDIDWSQSKIVFISSSFTIYQKEAINFNDLPIELWEVKRYCNNTISYQQIINKGSQESIRAISKLDSSISNITNEIKIYSETDHLAKASEQIIELYEMLKNKILTNYDDINVKIRKYYIAFISKTNFVDIRISKKDIKIWLNLPKGKLNDPQNIARDVSAIGHWGNGDYELILKNLLIHHIIVQ